MRAEEARHIAKQVEQKEIEIFCVPILEAIRQAAHEGKFFIEYPYSNKINPCYHLRQVYNYDCDYIAKRKVWRFMWFQTHTELYPNLK